MHFLQQLVGITITFEINVFLPEPGCGCAGCQCVLKVSPTASRVNELVYWRLAQLVGARQEHLDTCTLSAIVNKRLVGSGGDSSSFSMNHTVSYKKWIVSTVLLADQRRRHSSHYDSTVLGRKPLPWCILKPIVKSTYVSGGLNYKWSQWSFYRRHIRTIMEQKMEVNSS